MTHFTESQRLSIFRLARTNHVGSITYHQLIKLYGTADNAIEALPHLSQRGGRNKPLHPISKATAEKEIRKLTKFGGNFLVYGENNYPVNLKNIPDAPIILSVLGNPHLLSSSPNLTIIGTRNASIIGLKMTEKLSKGLSEAGFTIVSGMAKGIDTAAHWHAIQHGTIAVLAGGIDNIYPPENKKLYERLRHEGLIVTENAFSMRPLAQHFPRRNRIISGLSIGTLVIEAALRSGSLITARTAGEQGREVMAIPGSPLDPRCRGTNHLLKNGAALIETVDDVLDVINLLKNQHIMESEQEKTYHKTYQGEPIESERDAIMTLLSATPVTLDDIIHHSELPVPLVHLILIELELAGRLHRNVTQGVSLIPD